MSQPALTTRSLLELIGWFERSRQPIVDAQGQRLYGVPAGQMGRHTAWSEEQVADWTECIGYAASFAAPCGDELVPVELEEEDENPERFRYRCPETFRKKWVAASHVAVHAVRTAKLLHLVADLVAIPQALRRSLETAALADVLWHLGTMRIGNVHVDAWLVRGLSASVEQVLAYFEDPARPDKGVIFTAGATLPRSIRPPRDYRIIPIADVLVMHTAKPCFDIDLIERLLVAAPGTPLAKSHPVQWNAYTKTLRITTRPHATWPVKGPRQIAAVQYLYDQSLHGRWWVPAHEILAAVYGGQNQGRSRRMQNLFAGNNYWEEFIVADGNGSYGFKMS